jgi:predicted Zn-dependent protease
MRDVGLAILVAGGMGLLIFLLVRPAELPEGISASQYQRAERLFQERHRKRPDQRDVFFSLGELSVRDKNWKAALASFQQIPSDDPKYGGSARLKEAQIYLNLHRAPEAESRLREFLNLAEREPAPSLGSLRDAYERLAYLLSVQLRFEERKQVLAEMHKVGVATVYESKQYYFPHLLIWRSVRGRHRLREFLAQDENHLPLLIAQGRYLTAEGKLQEARGLLQTLYEREPGNFAAAAALLECCYEAGDETGLAASLRSLPASSGEEPWLLIRMRGEVALAEQRWSDAIRAFRAVLHSDPANPECHMGLAKAYEALGQEFQRDEILRRSEILAKIRVFLSNVNEENPAACLELAGMCEQIELDEAARTYRKHAERISRTQTRPASPKLSLEANER